MLRSLLFTALLAYIFTSQAISQTPSKLTESDKRDRLLYGVTELAGPLKSVVMEEAHFSAKPNKSGQYVEEGRKHLKTVFLDKDGKVTGALPESRRFTCGTKGSDESKRTELFDARGEMTGATEETFDVTGKLTSKTVYEYGSERRTRAYSWAMYDDLGSIIAKRENKYDTQGNTTEAASYGKYGLLISKDIYIHNEKGLVVESLEYRSANPQLVKREAFSYEYDAFGNWVKRTKSKFVTERGSSFLKPVNVEYRIITYHSLDGEK